VASNSFGTHFRITTWGESHGKAVGLVLDGCPPGIAISEDELNEALLKRAPGNSPFVSERKEKDEVEILSGVFEGHSTGAPILLSIKNHDADSSKYEALRSVYRPGHANFTYLQKYGIFDHRGGGRSSARETAARVAGGAIAQKLLDREGIQVVAFLKKVGTIQAEVCYDERLAEKVYKSLLFCPDSNVEEQMAEEIMKVKNDGDSIGGIVECVVFNVPVGLGDPIYEKLSARLAYAMMSIPAVKGFEIGEGFSAATMRGSFHNDSFSVEEASVKCSSNHAGGVLGGITTGEQIYFRVAFKPTSSIKKPQQTVSCAKEAIEFSLPEGSRHDPCVAIRAVPVVKAMCQLVLADALLV
jgi:chorismate synthase